MPSASLSYPKAIKLVLSTLKRPLSMFEIEREIVRRELIKKVNSSSIRHAIYKDLEKGDSSIFLQIEYNLYSLRSPELVAEINHLPVLVFNSEKLKELGYFHTIKKEIEPYFTEILNVVNPIFISRSRVEGNANYKQVVSYALITYKNKLLRFTRHEYKRNRSLDFIDGKYSLGFGGHVQHEDLNLFTIGDHDSGYTASLFRELKEETGIEKQDIKNIKLIGVLNDDSTIKGKCHFAFLHLIELANPKFEDTEKWVIKPELVSFEQITEEFENYEYWSKLCLEHFFSKELRNLKFNCFIDNRRGLSLKKNFPYLAIVGEIGSGKSQVCSLLVEQYEYTRIPCSQILRELMSSKAKTRDDRHKLQDAGYKYINKRGAHKRFARKIVEYIKSKAANKTILIDGLRYKETFLEIQKELGVNKIPLIYVQSNREDQYRNFISREKSEATVVDFMEIIEHPVESFVGQFLEYTDIFIYNFGSLDSLTKEVGDYLQKEPTSAFLIDAWDNNAAYRHNQILRGADLTFDNLVTPYFINSLKKHKDYPNLRVLDIGCGTGILTNLIAEHAKHITAIDHSSASIQVAKQHTVKKNINFQSENAERFVVENSFDVVIANMSLHSIEGLELTLKNIYSSLKSNGALIFSLPHPRYYPERERLRDVFKLSGFDYTKPSFHKIPFTISLEPEPLPSLIPYFHRPVSYYENIISKTGFWIIETFAPMPDEALMRKYRKSWQTPHVLLGFAIKPQSN